MPPSAATIFLVDDDASFLRATAVKSFGTAAEFLTWPELDVPGCALVDLQMPGLTGLELQAALPKKGYLMPVIFLSGQGDIPTTVQAMRRGAEDFLTKRAPKEELIETVKRALARDAHDRAERARVQRLRARFETLSERDREVLQHVLRGQLNKQIAVDLGIDERSVKRHRSRIMARLQVQSVAELTHLAHEAGLA
jgi:FixJ family two-component response regulator